MAQLIGNRGSADIPLPRPVSFLAWLFFDGLGVCCESFGWSGSSGDRGCFQGCSHPYSALPLASPFGFAKIVVKATVRPSGGPLVVPMLM